MLTYFSPRLSTEHDRVANLISADEVIMDLFTGIGPFALLCAKRHKVQVYAIDINEQAIRCLEKSLSLNRLQGKVVPIVGNARQIIAEQLQHKADRIIMNLPHDAFAYLDVAVTALKHTGGFIHYYGITTAEKPLESLCATVITQLKEMGVKVQVVNTRIVRPAAPHEDMVVLDLHVESTDTITAT
jgi:tRNA (guanine37-N1)-methyltransferase